MRKFVLFSLKILFVLLAFSACSMKGGINKSEVQPNYSIDSVWESSSKRDTAFTNLIGSYKSQLDSEMNVVISVCDEAMIAGKPESKLSNFIADAMLAIGNGYCAENQLSHSVDIAIMNHGGIRTALPKGEITTGRVFEMLPFKNKLVIVAMKGQDLLELLNQLAKYGGEGISGMRMGIHNQKAVDVLIQGKSIEPEKVYHIISVDYLVNGGGGMTAFEKRETFSHLHKKLRSEFIKYINRKYQKGEHISAELDGRIYNVE